MMFAAGADTLRCNRPIAVLCEARSICLTRRMI